MIKKTGNRKVAAALLSGLVFPGAGQLYNRDRVKGALIILAVLAVLGAVAVKTWFAAIDAALYTPPDELLSDVFGLAHRIVESERVFFIRAGWALIAVWVYGVIDAFAGGGRGGRSGDSRPDA